MSGAEFAGALSVRVTIERRDPARDDLGGAAGAWSALGCRWAALTPAPAASWGEGDRPAAPPRWRASLRRATDVAPGDRLRWGTRLLAVRETAADPATPDRISLLLEEDR